VRFLAQTILLSFGLLSRCGRAEPKGSPPHGTNIFAPASTPSQSIADLSVFVLIITESFLSLFLRYWPIPSLSSVGEQWMRPEPAQVYGSTQIELAWTIIPTLIVVVLFLATARVIHAIQDAPEPAGAVQVTAIGHQFWWNFDIRGWGSSPLTNCTSR